MNSKENLPGCGSYTDAFNYFGVKPEEGKARLKKAFNQLAKEYHPDKTKEDNETIRDINWAYDTASAYYEAKSKETIESEVPKRENFSDLFARYANRAPPDNMVNNENKKKPDPAKRKKEEEIYEFSFMPAFIPEAIRRYTISLVKEQENFLNQKKTSAIYETKENILKKVLGSSINQIDIKQINQLGQSIFSLEQFGSVLYCAEKILNRSDQKSPDALLNLTKTFLKANSIKEMVNINSFCQAFIEYHFLNSAGVKLSGNQHYLDLFQRMFTLLSSAPEKKDCFMVFALALNTVQKFTDTDLNLLNQDARKRAKYETSKIFALIIQNETLDQIEDARTLLNNIYYSISGNLIKDDWELKLKPVFEYIDYLKKEKGYTQQEVYSLFYITALIKIDPKTVIQQLNHTNSLIKFIKQLEKTIPKNDLKTKEKKIYPPAIDFVKAVSIGVRGYINANFKTAADEWTYAYAESLEIFKHKQELFILLMNIFKEFGIGEDLKGEEKELLWYEGIRLPVKTAVYAVKKIIEKANNLQFEEKLKNFQELLKSFKHTSYCKSARKHDDYPEFSDIQKKVYPFLNAIQKRNRSKKALLPDDADKLIEFCF